MITVTVLSRLEHDNQPYNAGDQLELPKETASRLALLGVVALLVDPQPTEPPTETERAPKPKTRKGKAS